MARFMDFPEDLNLPAQAREIVMSRIPRIRRWPGVPTGLAGSLLTSGAAAPTALANRVAGPA
jgi:hypothetical protein